jgi:hypothetical protein
MVHKEKSSANSQGSNHQTIKKENHFCYSKLTYIYLNHQPHSFPLLGCGVHPLLSPKHRSPNYLIVALLLYICSLHHAKLVETSQIMLTIIFLSFTLERIHIVTQKHIIQF